MALRFYRVTPHCFAIILLGTGCVAFNVGREKTFTHVDRHVETASEPSKVEVVSAEAQLKTLGNEVIVSLGADVKEEFEKRVREEAVTVRQRKRLAVGLFPGAAEFMLMPKGALRPAIFAPVITTEFTGNPPHRLYDSDPRNNIGWYAGAHTIFAFSFGLLHSFATIGSVLVAPSDDWRCGGHDFIDPNYVRRIAGKNGDAKYDASASPKLRSLLKFSPSERNQIGVNTCFYSIDKREKAGEPIISHLGLVGFHKYLATFVEKPTTTSPTPCGVETKRRNAEVTGPFIAELSIPVLGHNDWKRVSTRESRATFALPPVERDLTVETIVSFRKDGGDYGRGNAGDITEQAIAKAAGRQWRFDITMKGRGVVDPAQPEAPYRIGDVRRGDDSKYTVRVDVLDQSETFAIHRRVRPDVQRMILEDYAGRNPGVPARDIRHVITMETDKDGKALFYAGWAVAVKPVENGWSYDPNTRRGWVRVRISGGLSADAARRWARENIEAIVADKNVVVTVGEAPPPGAKFRSLGETFENGVLKVTFEAMQ